jgi:hypothetical protein
LFDRKISYYRSIGRCFSKKKSLPVTVFCIWNKASCLAAHSMACLAANQPAKDREVIGMTSISDALRDAGSSSMFWIGLAIVLIIATVGYFLTRRAAVDPPPVEEGTKVVHDWIPTGRIDFAGPSMDESAAETPASFYLQAEDVRFLISFSGIERKELRWRKATLSEAKKVVNTFHRQMAKEPDRKGESALRAAAPPDEGATESAPKGEG